METLSVSVILTDSYTQISRFLSRNNGKYRGGDGGWGLRDIDRSVHIGVHLLT